MRPRKPLVAVFVLAAVLGLTGPASAGVINGGFEQGFTGWTWWVAPWTSAAWAVAPGSDVYSGTGSLEMGGQYGSFGMYQAISTIPGVQYQIDARWKGQNAGGQLFWNEIMFFNDDGRPIMEQIDSAPNQSSILAKVDAWGMNWPVAWGWKDPFDGSQWNTLGPHTSIISATGTTMYVALKAGTTTGDVNVLFDDIAVNPVPEPASLLLLGTGLSGLVTFARRRRR